MLNIQHTTVQTTELFNPRGGGKGVCYFQGILLGWCCLELAHLVQDKDAKSQEEGELQEAHDASLQGNNQVNICTSSKFYEPTELDWSCFCN